MTMDDVWMITCGGAIMVIVYHVFQWFSNFFASPVTCYIQPDLTEIFQKSPNALNSSGA